MDSKPSDSTHAMTTRSRTRTQEDCNSTTIKTTLTRTKLTQAKKYTTRDAHTILFQPKLKPKQQKKPHAKKKRPEGCTDKQRKVFADAHYIVHHGTAKDADHFLNSKSNRDNITDNMLAALKLMRTNPFEPQADSDAALQLPTQLHWVSATGKEL